MIAGGSNIVSYGDYVAGWLDSSLHDVLGLLPSTAESLKYVLVTCIDSNTRPRSLLQTSPELKAVSRFGRVLGDGLLMPTAQLVAANSGSRIFFGFDEVWFFPNAKIKPKPKSDWLVGPARVGHKTLESLGPWMSENACSLAMGDGQGLNFVVKARGLVRTLLGHSIGQPEPKANDDAIVTASQLGDVAE